MRGDAPGLGPGCLLLFQRVAALDAVDGQDVEGRGGEVPTVVNQVAVVPQ